MKSQIPAITVVALCYNHEKFLIECLESIRAQTFQEFQLIVTDDNSVDRSAEIIGQWLVQYYPSATFIRNEKNRGLCAVLNSALASAQGKYFALVSADDVWEPTKLEKQLALLESSAPDVAMIYSDASRIDEQSRPLPTPFIEFHWQGLKPPTGNIYDTLVKQNFIPAMSTLIRTDYMRSVGGYDERLAYEDYDMWLQLSNKFKIVFLDEMLARYRVVSSSLSHQIFDSETNPKVLFTHALMALKQLRTSRLTAEQTAQWRDRLSWNTVQLYLGGDKRAGRIMVAASYFVGRLRWIPMGFAAMLGISRTRLLQLARKTH